MNKAKKCFFIFSSVVVLLAAASCSRAHFLLNWNVSIDPPTDIRHIENNADNVEAYQVWEYGSTSIAFLDRITEITEADIEKAETYLDSLFATLAYYPNKVNAISQIVDSEQLISSGNYIYYDTNRENTVLLLIFDTKKGDMYYFSSEQTG